VGHRFLLLDELVEGRRARDGTEVGCAGVSDGAPGRWVPPVRSHYKSSEGLVHRATDLDRAVRPVQKNGALNVCTAGRKRLEALVENCARQCVFEKIKSRPKVRADSGVHTRPKMVELTSDPKVRRGGQTVTTWAKGICESHQRRKLSGGQAAQRAAWLDEHRLSEAESESGGQKKDHAAKAVFEKASSRRTHRDGR